jgi:hypothetical protein
LLVTFPAPGFAQRPDSLTLQQPDSVYVIQEMNQNRREFVNWIFWQDVPDSVGTFIHQPDTAGWHVAGSQMPADSISFPSTSGSYTGSIDRTIKFRVRNSGRVGVTPVIRLRYEIAKEEYWTREINIGAGYTPNAPIDLIFISQAPQNAGDTLDVGLRLHFPPGLVDSNGVFLFGVEDFEGFHIWRSIAPNGSDMIVLGELSKQEEFLGSPIDSLYFNAVIPALRTTGHYEFPAPVPGLGSSINLAGIHPYGRLGPNELLWFDYNVFNGFTYYYTVTSFDRDYIVSAQSQGLTKFDNCPVTQGQPYPCQHALVALSTSVTPQNDLSQMYAVPNPYRSGTSQFTTPNYQNFPDNKLRFVNVPVNCKIRIYTVSGDFVFEITNMSGTGTAEWDTTNTAGQQVASGAYIYRCESSTGGAVYGRIIIIR